MYWIIKLIQSLVKALNSEGTPAQVAAGMAVGACLGLTPLMNLHNLVVVAAILFFRVSVPGALLGWMIFTPVGFLLDPVFDGVGRALLMDADGLRDVWAAAYNTPILALANPTNTIVVGSFVGWVVLSIPIFFLARFGVARYRATIYARYKDAKFFRALRASKVYNAYKLFRPGA
ncbi:MAG: TIGR03546 family protein [Gemmatimonadota bacterium]